MNDTEVHQGGKFGIQFEHQGKVETIVGMTIHGIVSASTRENTKLLNIIQIHGVPTKNEQEIFDQLGLLVVPARKSL